MIFFKPICFYKKIFYIYKLIYTKNFLFQDQVYIKGGADNAL